jgi:aminoglycoside phosphotransferase (APT) family kinase protein
MSAVIDFGDLTAGDPAADMAVGWMLFDASTRTVFREALTDTDDETWARAWGWALALSVAFLANSADNAIIAAIAARTLAEVMAHDPE